MKTTNFNDLKANRYETPDYMKKFKYSDMTRDMKIAYWCEKEKASLDVLLKWGGFTKEHYEEQLKLIHSRVVDMVDIEIGPKRIQTNIVEEKVETAEEIEAAAVEEFENITFEEDEPFTFKGVGRMT